MTKQELVKMMGNEDKAMWAMERLLESVKPDFVLMVLKDIADTANKKYTERTQSGYYEEFSRFPDDFNLFSVPDDSPLAKQYEENTWRKIEEQADKTYKTFTNNMYCHALWNKPESK